MPIIEIEKNLNMSCWKSFQYFSGKEGDNVDIIRTSIGINSFSRYFSQILLIDYTMFRMGREEGRLREEL